MLMIMFARIYVYERMVFHRRTSWLKKQTCCL